MGNFEPRGRIYSQCCRRPMKADFNDNFSSAVIRRRSDKSLMRIQGTSSTSKQILQNLPLDDLSVHKVEFDITQVSAGLSGSP